MLILIATRLQKIKTNCNHYTSITGVFYFVKNFTFLFENSLILLNI